MVGKVPLNTNEDQELLQALKQHDKKQFEVLYKKYYKPLFTVALRYLGRAEAAEEVVHDVFIKIWNKADQLDIQISMKSYLFRSVVNSSLNVIKKEKADSEKRAAYLIVNGQDDEIVEQELSDNEEDLLRGLEAALSMLPDKCKQVMLLSRFGKLKQQEIADQMDISIKTVKNHLTYGFKKLREYLDKHKQLTIVVMLLKLLTL